MSNLKQSFDQVRAALGSLDTAIADALNEQTQAHRNELIELTQSYQARLAEQKEKYETRLADLKEDLEELRQNADEALDTQAELEAEKAGLLKTGSPLKRILFEKLADRWEFLTNSEIEMLESVIDGKAVVL